MQLHLPDLAEFIDEADAAQARRGRRRFTVGSLRYSVLEASLVHIAGRTFRERFTQLECLCKKLHTHR